MKASFFRKGDFLHLDDFVKCLLSHTLSRTNCSQGSISPLMYHKFGFDLFRKQFYCIFKEALISFQIKCYFLVKHFQKRPTQQLDNRIKKPWLLLTLPGFRITSVTCVQLLTEKSSFIEGKIIMQDFLETFPCILSIYVPVIKQPPYIKYRRIPLPFCFSFINGRTALHCLS